ncbi:MAG TPA: hypothetical protein PLS04_11510, partial [Mycobacterium sp.]|nr:hypothetical protein [Mycobacterium sp.]
LAVTAEVSLAADVAELVASVFFSSLEQPDIPATTTAAPATATTKPRFTDFSFVEVIRQCRIIESSIVRRSPTVLEIGESVGQSQLCRNRCRPRLCEVNGGAAGKMRSFLGRCGPERTPGALVEYLRD